VEKKGFEGKRKEVDHVEGSYRGRKNPFQKYHTPSFSPQITNINLKSSFPTRKPKPQTKHQKIQEQLPLLPLPLNEMYQKLLSIRHIAPEPLTPLQPPYPTGTSLTSLASTMLALRDTTFIPVVTSKRGSCI